MLMHAYKISTGTIFSNLVVMSNSWIWIARIQSQNEFKCILQLNMSKCILSYRSRHIGVQNLKVICAKIQCVHTKYKINVAIHINFVYITSHHNPFEFETFNLHFPNSISMALLSRYSRNATATNDCDC